MRIKPTLYLCIIFLPIIIECDNSTPKESVQAVSDDHQIIGVSIWDRISSRSEPRRASSSATLLSLGESFSYLDTFAIDSSYNNTKFLKARLSDSSIVWVYGFASVLNAKPAVITSDVPLYMRPDLLTITDKSIDAMEITAVIEEWDNWIKVVSEKKEKVGWIKKDFITYNTIDLAFALIAKRKLEEEDPEKRIGNLEDLLKNNPYPSSIFVPELQERLDTEKEILRENRDILDREDDNQYRWR
jgi:hypothetical protein